MQARIKKILKKTFRLFQYKIVSPVYIPLLQGNLLQNKNILITGGSGGIGIAIAKCCLNNGDSICIAGRNHNKLESAKYKLMEYVSTDNQVISTIVIDIKNISTFDEVIIKASKLFRNNCIDVLINCAGVGSGGEVGVTDEKQFDETLLTNLKGTYFMCQSYSNFLIKNKKKVIY